MISAPNGFACEDYLRSTYASTGCWDEAAQLWTIVPMSEVEVVADQSFMAVGRPGVDGILFGYRKDYNGVWAYHPVEREFQWLAADIHAFIEGWQDGSIVL